MANYQYMMSADDVAKELDCSKSYAYKLVKAMNKDIGQKRCSDTSWLRTKRGEERNGLQRKRHEEMDCPVV